MTQTKTKKECPECEGEGYFITDTECGYATGEETCRNCKGKGFIQKEEGRK